MDEKKLLETFAKALGTENVLTEIEARKEKEKKMLDSMAKSMGVVHVLEEVNHEEELLKEKKKKEKELLDKLNETFTSFTKDNEEHIKLIEQEIQEIIPQIEPEVIIETAGRQPEPELPKKDIINRSVELLSKPNQQDGDIQKVADKLPPGVQKELDIIKKSIADFHRFAQRHSQMGGGGEVRLARLDDVNASTISDGLYLRYDASTKMFVFDDPALSEPAEFQSDWNEANTAARDYIKNKPPIYVDANNRIFADVSSNNIVFSSSGTYQPFTFPGRLAQFSGSSGLPATISVDSFGNTVVGGAPNYVTRRFGDGLDSPTAVANGMWLGTLAARGYNGTGFPTNAYNGLVFYALEDYSNTNMGAALSLQMVPAGSNTTVEAVNFTHNTVSFTASLIQKPGSNATLGTLDNPWSAAYFTANSIYILPEQANGTISILENSNNILSVKSTGFAVYNPNGSFFSMQVDSNYGQTLLHAPNPIPGSSVLSVSANPSSNSYPLAYASIGGVGHFTGPVSGPTNFVLDNFDNSGVFGLSSALTFRRFHGTPDSPSAVLSGDQIGIVAGVGYNGNNVNAAESVNMRFVATENWTTSNLGSKIEFWTIPTGTATFTETVDIVGDTGQPGLKFIQSNSGITFTDGSFQNTAFNSNSAVTSITVGTGLTQTSNNGAVGINATGVLSVTGTPNQILVANVGQNITLSTPQNLNTNATVMFNTLTVANLTVTGTSTIANTTSISDKLLHLAYNSTSASQIDGGGITLGNTSASYTRSILYNLAGDYWTTDGSSLVTQNITANTANTQNLNVANGVNIGTNYLAFNYPNAGLQVIENAGSYAQILNQNLSNNTSASTDFVATNDIGSDTANYIDMGINSSTWSNTQWTINGPSDGYLYVDGGSLAIGTDTAGKTVSFFTGNTLIGNLRATINDNGLNVVNNINAYSINTHSVTYSDNTVQTTAYVIPKTTTVTTNYSMSNTDYYVGVANNTANVSITLPSGTFNGKQVVIKDESGNCASNPITIIGTIDNQSSAYMKLNNMSLTLIYNNGWRII